MSPWRARRSTAFASRCIIWRPTSSWVLSGINPGGNLGTDVHHSGTVAAVREGAIRGIPGIAVSHYIARGRAIDWSRAARWAGETSSPC